LEVEAVAFFKKFTKSLVLISEYFFDRGESVECRRKFFRGGLAIFQDSKKYYSEWTMEYNLKVKSYSTSKENECPKIR
jgi:hypothetical protein